MKRYINIGIFILIFSLYLITFLMIYDTFRERKLNSLSKDAMSLLDKEIKQNEDSKEEVEEEIVASGVSYAGYTILGKLEAPKVGISVVILKEHTYAAMNLGAVKTYGVDLNTPGGFVISGHNFRGKSTFLYSIKNLKNGDKIYITDTQGQKMEYTVYSVERNVSPTETSYYSKTEDCHVTIVTCENGGKARIVVKAHALQ